MTRKNKILVADDDPDILQFVRVNLELEGFEVETAANGQEAVDKVLASPPDVCLLDVMMPEMDGLTALQQASHAPAAANVSIILLTAKALAEDRVKDSSWAPTTTSPSRSTSTELIARVAAVLRRTQHMRDLSPLTGLPGQLPDHLDARDRRSVDASSSSPWCTGPTSTTSSRSTTTTASCAAIR